MSEIENNSVTIALKKKTIKFQICRFGSDTDWIFNTPIAVVLVLNLMFLMAIMWVLITKLRSANTVETQQYHKAAKALLVLMPLLGITYIITIYCPPNSEWTIPITRIRCVLLSTQVSPKSMNEIGLDYLVFVILYL